MKHLVSRRRGRWHETKGQRAFAPPSPWPYTSVECSWIESLKARSFRQSPRGPGCRASQTFPTAVSWGLREIAADRYRAYDSIELVCTGDVDPAEFSSQLSAGARIDFRLRHPESPDLPFEVVEWEACEPSLIGSNTRSAGQEG